MGEGAKERAKWRWGFAEQVGFHKRGMGSKGSVAKGKNRAVKGTWFKKEKKKKHMVPLEAASIMVKSGIYGVSWDHDLG